MAFCTVTLTFESVNEILRCDHSNESSLRVLIHGAICFSNFPKMEFGNLVEICFWLNWAVKGLKPGYTVILTSDYVCTCTQAYMAYGPTSKTN